MNLLKKEDILFYTKEWQGERYEDGRPKVSDSLLDQARALLRHG